MNMNVYLHQYILLHAFGLSIVSNLPCYPKSWVHSESEERGEGGDETHSALTGETS